MHRKALVLSLSCLTLAGMAACGNAAPTGNGLPPGSGNAPGSSGGAGGAMGGAGAPTSGGVGGSFAAGAGGLSTVGGAGGASGAANAGAGGLAAAGSGGSGGSAGSAVAGAGGSNTAGSGGSGGLLSAVPDSRGIYGHPDPNTTYPDYPGFKPYLVEEFNAPIDLNRDPFWTWGDGVLADGMTHMAEKNIAFENGHMVLSLTSDPQSGGYSFSAADFVPDKQASSAEFRSIYNEFRYGRYEVRMKPPAGGSNNFLHTMFVYRAPAFLLWREIDIEMTASPSTDFISNIIVAPPGTRLWNAGIEDSSRSYPTGGGGSVALPAGFATTSDFHTYAFEWLPDSVKWFVDGNMVRVKVNGSGKNNLVIPTESTKIIMNMWVFGNADLGGGNPLNNQYPIKGEYDWFRYYRANIETTYPCADPNTHSCLTADDLKWSKNNPKDPLPDTRPPLCTSATGMQDTPCGP